MEKEKYDLLLINVHIPQFLAVGAEVVLPAFNLFRTVNVWNDEIVDRFRSDCTRYD